MSQFATKVTKGNISSYVEAMPQMHASDNIPEKGVTCPQCDTTFVADKVRECLFCGYKEGREIDQEKALRYKMKCS